jgi:uncharacterized protein
LAAIEHYLIVRYFMYAQVYNHPKNLAATWVLERAFARAKQILPAGDLIADEIVTAWLKDSAKLSLAEYLAADDGVFLYHLQRWQNHSDLILSDLCQRYLDRNLFKTLDITDRTDAERHQILQQAQQKAQQQDLDPDYYIGLRVALSRGYTLYQRGINLQTAQGLEEISERSPLVKTLSEPMRRAWLIYPRSVTP